jgi:multidrug efflux pump
MTSLAFILGVVPLVLAHGAGAEMRRTLGTTVFSGMLGVTLFGIFLTPVFFYVIDTLGGARLWNVPWIRWFNAIVLGTLSLHPVRVLFKKDRRSAPRPLDASPSPSPSEPSHPSPRSSPVPAGHGEPVEQE